MNYVIAGSAFAPPTEFYSSSDLEILLKPTYDRLKLPYGRLEALTGITRRGCYASHLLPSDIAAMSAKVLMEKMQLGKNDIQALIYTGVCRDSLEPATTARLHHLLGLSADCLHFDVTNACLGMMNGIQLACQLLASAGMENILVVTGENSHPMLKHLVEKLNSDQSLSRSKVKDHIASLTLGSASLALLISKRAQYQNEPKILGFEWMSDTSAHTLCQAQGDYWHPNMHTQSEKLLQAGVALGKKLWQRFDAQKKAELQYYVTHQVGSAHHALLAQELALNYPSYITYPEFGNTGSAAVGLTWHMARQQKNLKGPGVWLGIGSGLNAMLMHIG